MEIARISSKGQITIPVSVRNRLKLKTGDKVFPLMDVEMPEIMMPEFLGKY